MKPAKSAKRPPNREDKFAKELWDVLSDRGAILDKVDLRRIRQALSATSRPSSAQRIAIPKLSSTHFALLPVWRKASLIQTRRTTSRCIPATISRPWDKFAPPDKPLRQAQESKILCHRGCCRSASGSLRRWAIEGGAVRTQGQAAVGVWLHWRCH